MADPYLGEIRLFGGNFAPVGWADCDGQLLPISEYDTLFTLIGTTYGGDGQESFALPDLQGRAPVHMGKNPSTGTTYVLGEKAGVESVALNKNQIAGHNHRFFASTSPGTQSSPGPSVDVARSTALAYVQDVPSADFAATSLLPAGGDQPHENRQPYLVVRFIISLYGIWPSQ